MKRFGTGLGMVAVVVAAGAAYAATGLAADAGDPPVQRVEIEVTAGGYAPASFELEAGVPAELVFTRTMGSGCASQVHSPDLDVPKTPLPQGEPVTIRIEAPEAGSYAFLCGMNMLEGTVVVKQ